MAGIYNSERMDEGDATPHKEGTMKAGEADLNIAGALHEFFDNVIDSANEEGKDEVNITVRQKEVIKEDGNSVTVVEILDDAGGVPEDQLDRLLTMGKTSDGSDVTKIGAYSVGGKKAAFRLTDNWVVRTRTNKAEKTVGFEVSEDWLTGDPTDYQFDVREFKEGVEAGTTAITLIDPKFDYEDNVEELAREVGDAYELFLRQGGYYDDFIDLSVTFEQPNDNPIEVTPPEVSDWVFAPFGAHPRRVTNIRLDTLDRVETDFDAPVYANITAGLVADTSDTNVGTDLYMQGRNILRNEYSKKGGFVGSDSRQFARSKNKRFRLMVDIRTTGDASKLPWTSVKSDVELRPLMEEVYSIAQNLAEEIRKLNRHKVSIDPLQPYTADGSYAANDGTIETHDNDGKRQIPSNIKPPEAADVADKFNDIKSQARRDANLLIKDTSRLSEEKIPAYEVFFDDAIQDLREDKENDLTGDLMEHVVTDISSEGAPDDASGAAQIRSQSSAARADEHVTGDNPYVLDREQFEERYGYLFGYPTYRYFAQKAAPKPLGHLEQDELPEDEDTENDSLLQDSPSEEQDELSDDDEETEDESNNEITENSDEDSDEGAVDQPEQTRIEETETDSQVTPEQTDSETPETEPSTAQQRVELSVEIPSELIGPLSNELGIADPQPTEEHLSSRLSEELSDQLSDGQSLFADEAPEAKEQAE